jgi:hypothetical protein
LAELDAQPPTSLAAGRSRKLIIALIVLAILPLLLPWPFLVIAREWIGPMEAKVWSHCGFDCPGATYWERIFWLVVLGPSILVALASILFGTIGIARRTTAPKDAGKYGVSLAFGICWAVLGLCIYGAIFVITGLVP